MWRIFKQNIGYWNSRFLMNLLSCHGFPKNIISIVMLNFPKRMLEYYFSKGFGTLECNFNILEKLPNEVKQIIYSEETDNSDYVMTCINTITSTPRTIKKFCYIKVYLIMLFK